MADGYSVDLSALEQVIKRLNGLVDTMDSVSGTAEYKTELPEGYLGRGFAEETALRNAHVHMKQAIADMVTELKDMIAETGQKTSTAHRSYDNREQEIKGSMR
ncbi:hypothetical protein [Streptomyces sp. NPDC093097]|uniref:hypothetical protein n=1 Tax=Streptomyces sp. NPDC093097 TaxID=3366027 RepID=UPI0038042007